MFNKILSSIGIGSARVNTVLLQEKIERGQETKGEVHIYGGRSEQTISDIYIHIDSEFHKLDDETTDFREVVEPILEIKITDPVHIKPNEEKVVPFSFFLPYYMPITFGDQKVTIETELDINFINHPVETHDFIVVDPMINSILDHLTSHGFKHTRKSGLCRHKQHGELNPTHFLQTFLLVKDYNSKVTFVGNEKDVDLYVYQGDEVHHYSIYRDENIQDQLEKINKALA